MAIFHFLRRLITWNTWITRINSRGRLSIWHLTTRCYSRNLQTLVRFVLKETCKTSFWTSTSINLQDPLLAIHLFAWNFFGGVFAFILCSQDLFFSWQGLPRTWEADWIPWILYFLYKPTKQRSFTIHLSTLLTLYR